MKRLTRCSTVLLLALLTLIPLSFGQTAITGDISGSVADPSGAVVPNAEINLKNDSNGQTQVTTTNGQGQFRFTLLKPGAYTVTANAAGLQTVERSVAVNLGQVSTVALQAGIANKTETVEVTAEAPLLQSDNANLSTNFNASQIVNLPAPGGDTTSYAFTAPGVTISTGGGYGNFSAYGLPSNSNLFTVNGNDNMDPYLNLNNSGASNLTLGANELQQIAVVENAYSVQYGRQAGAQVNSVTKSGSNQFHGNASYWYNGTTLNANDWFANHGLSAKQAAANPTLAMADGVQTPRGHAVNNDYAVSIGGHIIKDKLFFFADQEQLRYVLPGGGPVFLPSQQFENHILSTLPASQVPFYQNAFKLYNGAPGANRAVPIDTSAASGLAGGCGDFDGTAGFGTKGTPCATTFQSNVNNLNTEWLLSTRVDYNINSTDSLFGRFRTDHGVQATGTDPINAVFNANSVQPEYEGQLTETHIFGATATNQFIAAGSWYQALFNANNLPAALAAFPTTFVFNDGAPFTNLGGGGNGGGGDNVFPQGRNVTQWQLTDDFSKTLGNHELKIGANFRRNDVSSYATGPNTSGTFTFNSLTEFANGLLPPATALFPGAASNYSQAFRRIQQVPIALYSLGVYAQDQWKPRSNLSVTYGLRIDRNANPACVSNCFTRLASTFANQTAAGSAALLATPYNQSIRTGLSNAFPSVETIVLQPRVGFAYTVRPTTVVRAGIGLFSDLFPATLVDRFITNAPNVASFTSAAGNVAPGAGSVFANVAASNAAFQSGFANGATLASLQAAVPGFNPPNFNAIANRIANPKVVEYNFEVQHEFGNRVNLSLNYVGNYGFDQLNQVALGNARCIGASCPFAGIGTVAPDPRFGEIRDLNNHGRSNYNGFNPSVRWHLGDYLQASLSYTWSHAMDTCSNNCLLPFNFLTAPSIRNQISPTGLGLNYGPADYDTRHALSANYVLSAPRRVFNSNLLSSVLGGWTMAETVYYHTGYPYSAVNTGTRSRHLANVTGLLNSVVLADFLGGAGSGDCSSPSPNTPGNSSCLQKSQFLAGAQQLDFGNLNRNHFRGPMYFDTDLNLTKDFHLTERFALGIGANAFNVLNHPNFDLPVNNRNAGNFGQIIQAVGAPTSPYGTQIGSVNPAVTGRVLQLNARLVF